MCDYYSLCLRQNFWENLIFVGAGNSSESVAFWLNSFIIPSAGAEWAADKKMKILIGLRISVSKNLQFFASKKSEQQKKIVSKIGAIQRFWKRIFSEFVLENFGKTGSIADLP